MNEVKKFGLNLELENQHQRPEDWVFGATSVPDMAEIPEQEREKYLPRGERQNLGEDKMDCTTRAVLNILETKFNYLVKNKKLSLTNEVWLKEKGYVTDDGVEFSDAFNAILSGTTRQGNSLKASLDSVRKDGVIPKTSLPQVATFDEYHNPGRITPELRELGAEFARRFVINYQKVYEADYSELLKSDLLDVGGYAWPQHEGGIYPRSERDPNHAFILFKRLFHAFDNYIDPWDQDFKKMLAFNYNFLDHGYRVVVNKDVVIPKRINWAQDLTKRLGQFFRDIVFADKTFGAVRSSEWNQVRKENIRTYCELCEKKRGFLQPLEVHHIKPFHLYPALELEPSNLITVCRHCHLYFAHLGSFKSFNIDIKKDALLWSDKRAKRP